MFSVVTSGLREGDEVILNPLAYVDEAKEEALKSMDDLSAKRATDKAKDSDSKSDFESPVSTKDGN